MSGDDVRWVTVTRELHRTASQSRHLVQGKGETSLCGTTALPASLWRRSSVKPPCAACCDEARSRGIEVVAL